MPPAKKEEKIPATLDPKELGKLSEPLSVRVVRLREGGEVGEMIPLDKDRGYTRDEVAGLEYSGAVARKAGGGTFLATVWSETDPATRTSWRFYIPGQQVPPAETRADVAQAEAASRAADAAAAAARMPGQASFPWWGNPMNGSQGTPPPNGAPAATPWGPQMQQGAPQYNYGMPPFMGPYGYAPPYGMPQYGPMQPDPRVAQENAELRARLERMDAERKAEAEQARREREQDRRDREMEAKLAAERGERERLARETESRLKAAEEAADRRHREMLAALTAQQKPQGPDPAEVERRMREEFRQQQQLDAARREMETIKAESQRRSDDLQRQLADAQRQQDASAMQTLMQRMADMSKEHNEKLLAVVEKFRTADRADPLDQLIKFRQALGGDDTKSKLADMAMEMMMNPGGGTAQVVADLGGKFLEGAKELGTALIDSRKPPRSAALARGFAGLRAAQAQRPLAEAQRPVELGGSQQVAPAPAPQAPAPAAPPAEAPPVERVPDERYFGSLIFRRVTELRTLFADGKLADPYGPEEAKFYGGEDKDASVRLMKRIINFIIQGYMQATAANLEVPAIAEIKANPREFVMRLLPMAPPALHDALAQEYPPMLEAAESDDEDDEEDGEEQES